MKICIIKPPMPFGWTPVAPPILEYLAALTRQADPDVEIELVDASATPNVFDGLECDLAAISILTPTSVSGYRIPDRCETEVEGGAGRLWRDACLGASEEAKQHGDAVVVGEAESVWPQVLRDFRAGALKPFYHGERLPLDNLPTPLYGMLKGRYRFRGVNTSRGCPSLKDILGKVSEGKRDNRLCTEVTNIPA